MASGMVFDRILWRCDSEHISIFRLLPSVQEKLRNHYSQSTAHQHRLLHLQWHTDSYNRCYNRRYSISRKLLVDTESTDLVIVSNKRS